MVLNDREKKIAIGLGALLLGIVGYQYVYDPYMTTREQYIKEVTDSRLKLKRDETLIRQRRSVLDDWKARLDTGLASANTEIMRIFDSWATSAGCKLPQSKSEGGVQAGDFFKYNIVVTATGNMASVSRFLATIETCKLPIHIGDLHLTSSRDGEDNVTLQMTVEVLSYVPPTTKPAAPSQKGAT